MGLDFKIGNVDDADIGTSNKSESKRNFVTSIRWSGFENIMIKEVDSLTPDHYFLFTAMIPAFALADRTWSELCTSIPFITSVRGLQ